MKFQVKRVSGAQAESAERLGLVKITASSAEHLFDLGIPFYIVGNNVNGYHFFGGWHLAMPVNSEEYVSEGRSFRGMVGNWSQYNENSETGKAAFFVKRKYVASPEDVAAEAKKRSHKSKTGAKGKRFALPHSRIMMHQPSGGLGGTASDIRIQAEQSLHIKKTMSSLIAEHTGQSVEQIEADSDRDRWFTAEQALEYGFIDHVYERAAQIITQSPNQ